MKRYFLPMLLLLACAPSPAPAMTPEERKTYLDNLLKILPPDKAFTDWQEKTGELPPDFDALPRSNALPDPLKFLDGTPVKTPEDWAKRRVEIITLLEKYDIGSMPPKPKIDSITPVDAAAAGAGDGPGGPGGPGGGGRGFGRGGARGGPPAPGAAPGTAPATAPAGALAPALDSDHLFFVAAPGGGAPPARGPAGPGGPGAGRGAGGGFGPGGGFARGGPAPAGSVTKIVDLKYGPNSAITTRVTLTIPPGPGPFPVMIAGSNAFVSRGYINCTFPGTTDAPPDIGKYYPDNDWGSMAKIAWTTQVVIDYLETVPEVDKKHIATTGYSRDGKRALITAALDERIAAVIPGSTGVGGVYAWRDGSERNSSESIESTTRSFPNWFTQRLRFFSGREDRLPVDGNLILALVAPRACLVLWGDNDEVSQSWGMEHSVKSAEKAYAFVGKPDALGTMHIPGYHGANDVPRSIDWLDIQFGISKAKWVNDIVFPWDYDQWHAQVKALSQPDTGVPPINLPSNVNAPVFTMRAATSRLDGITTLADWQKKEPDITSAVQAMLGVNTPGTLENPFPLPKLGDPGKPGAAGRGNGGVLAPTLSDDIRGKAKGNSYGLMPGATTSRKISFTGGAGNTIVADLYVANNAPANTKLPVVIWEHGYSYSLGYSWVYKSDAHPIVALAQAGYAVLAYDQSGFGSRISEAAGFYNQYPQWSQMGHMIADTRAAIDALGKEDQIDTNRLYLYGFSMGGNLALYTAALDPRVKGVVAISSFTPMRTDTPDKGTGGIARLYRDKDILPNLGAYEGHEASIPYDYDELIAAIAPRPVYIISPTMDRETTPADVHAAVERARKIYTLYNAAGNLALDEPWDYSRLPTVTQDRAIAWMREHMK